MNSRRSFLRRAAASAALPLFTPLVRAAELLPKTDPRVAIVGGGFAGAIAAKTLRMLNPALEVVLIERNRSYSALPGANWGIGGSRRSEDNRLDYARLQGAYGVKLLHAEATALDVAAKQVVLASGTLAYDYAIVAPGIDFRFDAIPGYAAGQTPALFPHAWTSGQEVADLRRRLEAMHDGGLVIVALPQPPYRCPQAAYERVSQIACHLKQAKPRAKIIVLDPGAAPPHLGELFIAGWKREYRGLIEYRREQPVVRIDAPNGRIVSAAETLRGDVVNLIPPQRAGALAQRSGLTGDDGWCPVDHASGESTLAPGVYVVGDACRAGELQKSAAAANAQGKACALAIAATVAEATRSVPVYPNVVYSLLNATEGASSAAVYRGEGRAPIPVEKAGGESRQWSPLEGLYSRAWLDAILTETWS